MGCLVVSTIYVLYILPQPYLKFLNKSRNKIDTKKIKIFSEGSGKENHFKKKIEGFTLKEMVIKRF